MLFYVLIALFAIISCPIMTAVMLVVPVHTRVGMLSWYGRCFLYILRITDGITYEMVGRENLPEGGFVIAAEHQSPMETLILAAEFRNSAFVLRNSLKRTLPGLAHLAAYAKMVFIDRSAGVAALRQMVKECRERVQDGRIIIIFPEGTRAKYDADSGEKKLHRGIAALYSQLDLPVVPIVMNTGAYWPGGMLTLHKTKGKAVLKILEPIAPGLGKNEFMQALHDKMRAGKQDLLRPD